MANITSYLSTLRGTNDGETIRNAIADITEAVNTDNNSVITLLSGLSPTAIAAAAVTATTKAGEAAGSADDAMDSQVVATAQAGIATTKAAEALASKNAAGVSETNSKASETAAAGSAATATTKASESAASAAAALASEQVAAEHEETALAYKDATLAAVGQATDMAEIIESRKGKATLGEKISEIDSQLAEKANKNEIINGLTAKNGVKTWAQLQAMTTGNVVGDYYYCSDGDGTNPAGNYRWTGSNWSFGGTGDEGYNSVQTAVDNTNLTINSVLSPQIGEFSRLKILVTGDSITDAAGTAAKKWHSYLSDWLGCTIINDGKSATGLIRANAEIQGIYTRIDTWDTSYEDFDMILIMGNMSDGGIGSSFPVGNFTDSVATASQYGALHSTIQKLITKYPHKPIGWIISTPRLANTSYPSPNNGASWGNGWFEPYCQAIINVCNHYSIPFLDLYHKSNLKPWNTIYNATYFYDGDGVHPNNKGHEIIAYKIHEFIKNYMGANVTKKTNCAFELGTITSETTCVGYTSVLGRCRMVKNTFLVYEQGMFTVNDPAKHNIAVYLFKNPTYNSDLVRTFGYLNNLPGWSASQRLNSTEATHIQIAIKNMSGADFTAAEVSNMNKYITFIPD